MPAATKYLVILLKEIQFNWFQTITFKTIAVVILLRVLVSGRTVSRVQRILHLYTDNNIAGDLEYIKDEIYEKFLFWK